VPHARTRRERITCGGVHVPYARLGGRRRSQAAPHAQATHTHTHARAHVRARHTHAQARTRAPCAETALRRRPTRWSLSLSGSHSAGHRWIDIAAGGTTTEGRRTHFLEHADSGLTLQAIQNARLAQVRRAGVSPSPGADVAGVSPCLAQMWQG
jgi:hypothetical protein